MGETLGKIASLLEGRFGLYNGEHVKIDRLNHPGLKPRPKSEAMRQAYPELYDFLMKKEGAKKFSVGVIHVDPNGAMAKKLRGEGKTELQILLILKEKMREGLTGIAKVIETEPNGDLARVDFLTAASQLASAARAAKHLGFEVFEIDEGEELKSASASHRLRRETYDINPSTIPPKERDAKIALISREKILELYGAKRVGTV